MNFVSESTACRAEESSSETQVARVADMVGIAVVDRSVCADRYTAAIPTGITTKEQINRDSA